MTVPLKLLTLAEVARMPQRAQEVVEYRKSGLSLNHIQGCPLDCAYCIRHTYGVWDMRRPAALMSDADAVQQLVGHRYFRPHHTPVQVFNRATDPFLPQVVPHTLAVLEDLDGRGLTNHVLIITRHKVTEEHCRRMNTLRNLKLTLLFTYSGIDDTRIEPFPSVVSAESMIRASRLAESYRTVFYWRPLVPGLNDSPKHLLTGVQLSAHAHAAVFTGLFYRAEIAEYYRASGLPEPYEADARRKIVPETLEDRVLEAFASQTITGTLFRKTSCAVSFAHNVPDYNGHYGIRELCDICPISQLGVCEQAHHQPTPQIVLGAAARLPEAAALEILDIDDRAVIVRGLEHEQPRYYLQHALGYQVHDERHPHHRDRHGRADTGWNKTTEEGAPS